MAFASVESSGGRKWSEGEPQVEDEFICSAALRGAVLALQATVKRVFGVELDISVEEGMEVHQTGLMWLQLKGRSGDVLAAKLFVKGVVNQEEQQEVAYPSVLHCVFCGARGLFIDCLIRNTSAHIIAGSPGCLLISGLAEPVVRAYSLIVDLVERYDSSQGRRMDAGARVTGESLDSRRAFKDLVERWDDRHTLDLLVLPVSVKEVLLELVRESRWNTTAPETVMPQMDMDEPEVVGQSTTAMDRLSHRIPAEQLDTSLHSPGSSVVPTRSDSATHVGSQLSQQHQDVVFPSATPGREPPDPFFRSFAVVDQAPRGQVEGADEQQGWRGSVPQEVMDEASRMEVSTGAGESGRQDDLGLLLQFFTAMGFKEDTVKRVLSRTGALDPFDLLELVQQEQDQENGGGGGKEDISRRSGDGAEEESAFSGRTVERGMPNYSHSLGSSGERSPGEGLRSSSEGQEKGEEDNDDFVLGVVKRAAASCGYPEDQVREVFSNLPELSSHQLLLELQRQGKWDGKPVGTNIAETATAAAAVTATHTAQQRAKESFADLSRKEEGEVRRRKEEESSTLREAEGKASVDNRNNEKDGVSQGKLLGRQPSAKAVASFDNDGLVEHREIERYLIDQAYRNSSQEALAKKAKPVVTEPHENVHRRPPVAGAAGGNNRNTFNHQNHPRGPGQMDPTTSGGSSSIRGPPRPKYPHEMHIPPQVNPNMLATMPGFFSRPPQRQGLPQMGTRAIVTGQQRFLEGLQMPFELKLSGDNGDPGLRQIIIDGSNVAMSHGLGQYFSCRGIALAVQHFWDRGHRKISALVPQWRQKRDPRIKEQEYMFRLQDLGLLSFTPSREVMGKRINAYDDRLMLQLAQMTNGVIVTNDNMRDLFDESDDFKDIIRKSLLQYTFVGDHFMVPDDPLGRDGPHLNDFLCSQQSTRKFSGSSFTSPHAQHHRPPSEPLQFHDRAPEGGRVMPEFQSDHPDFQSQGREQVQRRGGRGGRGGRGRGVGGGRGHSEPQIQRQRNAEETSKLRASLMQVFPNQASTVEKALQRHPALTDVNHLSDLILEQYE